MIIRHLAPILITFDDFAGCPHIINRVNEDETFIAGIRDVFRISFKKTLVMIDVLGGKNGETLNMIRNVDNTFTMLTNTEASVASVGANSAMAVSFASVCLGAYSFRVPAILEMAENIL
jgi:hypothetical protein